MNNWAVEQTYTANSSPMLPDSIPVSSAKGRRDVPRSTLEGRSRLLKDLGHLQQEGEEQMVLTMSPTSQRGTQGRRQLLTELIIVQGLELGEGELKNINK